MHQPTRNRRLTTLTRCGNKTSRIADQHESLESKHSANYCAYCRFSTGRPHEPISSLRPVQLRMTTIHAIIIGIVAGGQGLRPFLFLRFERASGAARHSPTKETYCGSQSEGNAKGQERQHNRALQSGGKLVALEQARGSQRYQER